LRAPAWIFGPLALATMCAIALLWSAWAASGFLRFYTDSLIAFIAPALLGAGLALAAIWPRLNRQSLHTRAELIVRCAIGFAVAGLVWPLSFALAILLQGDVSGALSHMPIAPLGALMGAIGGALGGGAIAWTCFTRA
jgi:hypothetical protein